MNTKVQKKDAEVRGDISYVSVNCRGKVTANTIDTITVTLR